jgi:hypothetical protein
MKVSKKLEHYRKRFSLMELYNLDVCIFLLNMPYEYVNIQYSSDQFVIKN